MHTKSSSLRLRLAVPAAALALAACGNGSTANLDPDSLLWVSYVNPQVGYSLAHPDLLRPDEEGDHVFFRYRGGVPVLVRYTTEEEGRRRGAWFGESPVETTLLDGAEAEKYVYDHWDGPFRTRTVAYVVHHGDRFLGLEFRTPGDLDPVQERILDSFRLPPP